MYTMGLQVRKRLKLSRRGSFIREYQMPTIFALREAALDTSATFPAEPHMSAFGGFTGQPALAPDSRISPKATLTPHELGSISLDVRRAISAQEADWVN
jgi:hypothetical protein